MPEIVFIYVTCADEAEAEKIAGALLEKNLIACANIMPAHKALYRWEGQVETARETAVILKTRAELFPIVRDEILALHGYECPCIVAFPVGQGHEPFLRWVEGETASLPLY